MLLFFHALTMRYAALCTISFLVAGWLCYTVTTAFAQTDFDDITITPELHPSGTTFHGYAEYRIGISNRSPHKAYQVTLILPKTSYSYSGGDIRKISRSVVVGPSATVYVSLLQPPMQMNGHTLEIAIDGKMQKGEVPLTLTQHGRSAYIHHVPTPSGTITHVSVPPLKLRILISQAVDVTDLHTHAATLLSSPSSGSGPAPPSIGLPPPSSSRPTPPYETIDLGFPVSAWSTNWLGFSRYDGVIVTGNDIRQMPSDVQSALWRYVECGGALFVIGGRKLPESWNLKESLKSKISTDAAGIAVYDVGFGQCVVSPKMDTKSLDRDQWRPIVASWMQTALPWRWEDGVAESNTIFSVVSSFGIPVRGLFFLMLLFAIMIGPVNLIVLSRKKRRIWMLWTTPAISVITCLAVFVYATFAEGWNRHARTEGLTILDERLHRATTIGWTAFYSALTPSDGLHFGYETELTPLVKSMTTQTARTVDWTHNQHLANGWVTARVPAHFMVRKSEIRRERVTVRRGTDAGLRIVNGLGADISQFWLADRDGVIYAATDIPAGVETALTPFEKPRIGGSDEKLLFEVWGNSMKKQLDKGNITERLRDEMKNRGLLLSDHVTISVQQPGQQWRITDHLLEHSYNIKSNTTEGPLEIYDDRQPSLRKIFASENWIESIEHLKNNLQEYLRPGCYIATLAGAPFIENGLQQVTEKRYSSVVYGILADE